MPHVLLATPSDIIRESQSPPPANGKGLADHGMGEACPLPNECKWPVLQGKLQPF